MTVQGGTLRELVTRDQDHECGGFGPDTDPGAF